MLEIFVCDSDKNTIERIKALLSEKRSGDARVSVFYRRMDLIGMIQLKDRVPDILIIETAFRDGSGIDTAAEIQAEHPDVKVIYISRDIYQSTEIFKTAPSFFLTKPIDEGRLDQAVDKTVRQIRAERKGALLIKSGGAERVVLPRDVTYIESKARKLSIHLNGRAEMSIYEKMDNMQQSLGKTFVRCHKSFLVNLLYVETRENAEFVLLDGKRIPISSRRFREAKEAFTEYYKGSVFGKTD